MPIKLERCEIYNCNDAGIWIEKCGNHALPFELIDCYVHHNRVGIATRQMTGFLYNVRCQNNNYGLMVGTNCLVHVRGALSKFINNSEMNCVASGKEATVAIHVPPDTPVTKRNEKGNDVDSRKGGTIFNATTPRGQGILGQLYFNGQGVLKSYEKAKYWALMSAEQGFAESQYGLGQLYLRAEGVAKDYTKAKAWFLKAANQNHAPARRALALMYARGHGVQQSYTKALEMSQIAANMGLAPAQNDLAFMYAKGLGTTQSWDNARHWYELAAEQKYAAAWLNLGKMYFRGDGVEKSFARARQYFELAAKSSDSKASQGMYNLAAMYQHGKGVGQSNEKARALLKQAADRGHKQAIRQLEEWNRLNSVTLQHFWENM
jgi:TPR repeat protein